MTVASRRMIVCGRRSIVWLLLEKEVIWLWRIWMEAMERKVGWEKAVEDGGCLVELGLLEETTSGGYGELINYFAVLWFEGERAVWAAFTIWRGCCHRGWSAVYSGGEWMVATNLLGRWWKKELTIFSAWWRYLMILSGKGIDILFYYYFFNVGDDGFFIKSL